ncbi:MAG: response regulator transcription factor [Gemmatimonadetes bacterium]|nr:response regulator transcription factor [Gemmatimonadota bacterium]
MTRVLVVEDDPGIAEGLLLNLRLEGYDVRVAATGVAGLELCREWRPALVVLDLMLPLMDGMQLLRTLREEGNTVPVLILSARGDETDRLRGFRLGADDYVVKPFSLPELLARVAAMLRRVGERRAPAPALWKFGDIEVDTGTHEVRRAGAPVALRPREYDLLLALLRREGRVATRTELLHEVWSYEPDVVSRTVDVHVVELRRKLEPDPSHPRHLLTVRKTGYRLALAPAP